MVDEALGTCSLVYNVWSGVVGRGYGEAGSEV